ncbi:MAG TPA: ABC-F family ATP-binding cassette domain-containing protein [Ktedonobacterales bacterium]|jgi:ATP-binding cassette subfamily F protein 3
MSVLVAHELAKSFGADLIFSGAAFRVEPDDRVGLVGPNGAGKSTLLLLLAGQLTPSAGTVTLEAGTRVGYLPQDAGLEPGRSLYDEALAVFAEVHAWEAELADLAERLGDPDLLARPADYDAVLARYAELQARFEHAQGYTIEQRVRQVLDGLGFSREQQAAPTAHLSGGQATRAALGKLLLQDPDLLLLDEPTNHLDLAALEWLEEYLLAWHGAVIVVSHDRYFLDRVTTRTIEVSDARVTPYPGNYTRYVALRAERLERWAKEYEAQQEHIAHTEDFIRRYKAGQRSKEARGRQTLLDRMERIERPPAEAALHFSLGAAIQSGELVLRTEELVAGYPPREAPPRADISTDAPPDPATGLRVALGDVEVRRGERIGLIGPNGAGKTTLLRTIVGQLEALEGRVMLGHNVQVGYYAQVHEGLNLRATILDEIRHASHLSDEGARTFLGRFLFFGDDVFKPIGALSGGERSRVALAKLTLQGANFLVLDEPTNHLDLPARQVLERLLGTYDGTLLFVSHDRYFVDALAGGVWALADGTITPFAGNYTAFRLRAAREAAKEEAARARERQGAASAGAASQPARGASGRGQPARGQRAERTAELVEDEIAAAEARIAALERDLTEASAAADVARITELAATYEGEKQHLDLLYAEWEERAS